MRGLRIILDKSVVFGLNNSEVDSLDRYFFQIVPHILADEILADLTKEADPRTAARIAANTYRVSGNHGLTLNFRTRLANSPSWAAKFQWMDDFYVPAKPSFEQKAV